MASKVSIDVIFNAINRAGNAFSSINGQVNKLESRVQGFNSKVNSLFSISSMVGIGAGVGFLKLGADMEQNNVAFKVMLGSAEKATDVLGKLNNFANVTPFSNKEVIQAGRNLIAFNVKANDLESTMQRVGDVASGVRMPFTELAEIYGKIKIGNTAYNEDLNQLAGRGIPIFTELAKVMNVPEDQIKKLSSEGKITFKEIDKAFINMTSAGGKYAGMMNEMSKTAGGSWSTAVGKLTDGITKLSVSTMPIMTDMINGIIPLIDKVNELSQAHPELFKNIMLVAGGLIGLNVAGKVFGVLKAGALVFSSGILQPIAGISSFFKATKLMTSALAAGKLSTYSALIARYGMAGRIAAGGIWLQNAAVTAWNVITKFTSVTMVPLIAQTWAWTAALMANPVTWIVAGVMALVAALLLAWKHFDGFRGGVVGAWEGLKAFGKILIDSVLNPLKQLLGGIGKVGKAIALLFKGQFSDAWKEAKDGFGDIGGAALKMNPVYQVSQVINRRDEIVNAAASGYAKGKAIDTSNFLNFGSKKQPAEKGISAADFQAAAPAPFSVWKNPESPGMQVPGMLDMSYPQMPGMQVPGMLNMSYPEAQGMQVPGMLDMSYPQMPGMQVPGMLNMSYPQVPGMQVPGMLDMSYPQMPGMQVPGIMDVQTPEMETITLTGKVINLSVPSLSVPANVIAMSPTKAQRPSTPELINKLTPVIPFKNDQTTVDSVKQSQIVNNIERATKNITQNIANNNTTNQNDNSKSQKIDVTYSPQIHISAAMTKESQDDLMKILSQNKDQLMKLVREEERKNGRLSYAG